MKMEKTMRQVPRLEPALERRLALLEADVWLGINYTRIVAEEMGLKVKLGEIEKRYEQMRADIEAAADEAADSAPRTPTTPPARPTKK